MAVTPYKMFRGRRLDNQEWVFGDFFKTPITAEFSMPIENGAFFSSDKRRNIIVDDDGVAFNIDIDTLGQFLGVMDRERNRIYEGDILRKVGDGSMGEDLADTFYPALNDTFHGSLDVATMGRFPRYWLKNETFGYDGSDLENPREWVVVGNIYHCKTPDPAEI